MRVVPVRVDREVRGIGALRVGGELAEDLLHHDRWVHARGDPHVRRPARRHHADRCARDDAVHDRREATERHRPRGFCQQVAVVDDPERSADGPRHQQLAPTDDRVGDHRTDLDRPSAERHRAAHTQVAEPGARRPEHRFARAQRARDLVADVLGHERRVRRRIDREGVDRDRVGRRGPIDDLPVAVVGGGHPPGVAGDHDRGPERRGRRRLRLDAGWERAGDPCEPRVRHPRRGIGAAGGSGLRGGGRSQGRGGGGMRRFPRARLRERPRPTDDEDRDHRPEREPSSPHLRALGHRSQASHGPARVTARSSRWFPCSRYGGVGPRPRVPTRVSALVPTRNVRLGCASTRRGNNREGRWFARDRRARLTKRRNRHHASPHPPFRVAI